MVLIGKITNNSSTCLLFKLNPALRNTSNTIDTNNVFMMCPLHVLQPNTHKIKVQLIGDYNNRINSTIYVTIALFPIQHTFLDFAMGIVENPTVINENFKELVYVNILPIFDSTFINKPAQILYANKTGIVNNINTTIKDLNYTLEPFNNLFTIPHPGGFILTNEEAVEGMSGSILIIENNIVGIIIAGSDYNKNKSYAMAVDMYYILPHILQCIESIDKYTYNNPLNLTKLCTYTTMETFIDDLTPVVNHLGADYSFNDITTSNPQKHIALMNIHNYLDVRNLQFLQENLANSISIKTTLNNNNEFLDYFFNRQEDSIVIFKSANYYDRLAQKRIDIDFVQNTLFANILDWVYRGDPLQPLILNCQTKTINNNGSITLSEIKTFNFLSSKTNDNIFNQNYSRTSLQIPSPLFNAVNAQQIILGSFGMRISMKLLATGNSLNEQKERNRDKKTLLKFWKEWGQG